MSETTAVAIAPRQLRPYQIEAVDAVEGQWDIGYQRTSVVLPTGTGKSTVIGGLAVAARLRGERVVLLAHRDELLQQMSGSVQSIDPDGEPVGIVAAATNEVDRGIVAASFQTLVRSPHRIAELGPRSVILVDEAHHATSPTFLQVLRAFGINVPPDGTPHVPEVPADGRHQVRACGFTATMSRSDARVLGALWSTVAYEQDLVWAIENGYVVKPRGKTIVVDDLNSLASLKSRAGDYIATDLDTVMRSSVPSTVEAIMHHAQDRASIIFAVSREHGYELRDALLSEGLRVEVVFGKHTRAERAFIYEAFNYGGLDAIITVQVLTEGADFPRCDTVILARPTRSRVLFTQMVGRSVRTYTDPVTGAEKTEALVLDLTGSTQDTKIVTLTDLWGDAVTERVTIAGDPAPALADLAAKPPALDHARQLRHEHAERYGALAADTHLCTTDKGLVFMPSGEGRRSMILWPPHPQQSSRVYLLIMDTAGGCAVLRDDQGVPLHDTFDAALAFMIEMGAKVGIRRDYPETRGHTAPPGARQLESAEALGLDVDASTPGWMVTETILGERISQALREPEARRILRELVV